MLITMHALPIWIKTHVESTETDNKKNTKLTFRSGLAWRGMISTPGSSRSLKLPNYCNANPILHLVIIAPPLDLGGVGWSPFVRPPGGLQKRAKSWKCVNWPDAELKALKKSKIMNMCQLAACQAKSSTKRAKSWKCVNWPDAKLKALENNKILKMFQPAGCHAKSLKSFMCILAY